MLRLTTTRLIALALLILIGGGVVFRDPIVRRFPQLAGLYAALGLEVNLRGLEIVELRWTREADDTGAEVAVQGKVRGVENDPRPVPSIRISLRDKGGKELFAMLFPVAATTLKKGETVAFAKTFINGPNAPGVADVVVTFEDEDKRYRQ